MKKNKQTETTCSEGVILSSSGVTGFKGGVTGVQRGVTGCNRHSSRKRTFFVAAT